MSASLLERLAGLPEQEASEWLSGLSEEESEALWRDWRLYARPEQVAPEGEWRWWVVVTGRGWGKNRTGAEWVVERCEQFAAANHDHRVVLMNSTFGAVRSLQIDGESGLRAVCDRKGYLFQHAPTSVAASLTIPTVDGPHVSQIEVHTADIPDRVRGRNAHTAHCDELAAWRHKIDAEGATAFSNLDMALRSVCPPGLQPQGLVTTTPKPVKLIRDLLAERYGATEITRGRLFDNAVNLAPAFIDAIMRTYDGTRLGQQEVEGLLLDDVEGALWRAITLHTYRVTAEEVPVLGATVVAVDPPAEVGRDACGIITAAVSDMPVNDDGLHGYVLKDSTVEAATPEQWAQVVVNEFYRSKAREVVAEVNQGGDMVRATIHAVDPNVPVRKVRAKDGKRVRAEPVATQYERGRWHHVGEFPLLEEQLTTWTGDSREKSPDRLDALVWAATVLLPPAPVAAISLPGQSVRAGRGVF